MKDKFSKIAQDAAKAAETVKGVVQIGLETSKAALKKAGDLVNQEGIQQGIDVTSKGADIVAKGARVASKGATKIANTLERASESLKKMKSKIKKDSE